MTTTTITMLPNGDIQEVKTNPGCTPLVYINGIIQPLASVDYAAFNKREPWKPWFAWRPVRIHTGERVWLKPIYRRTVPKTYANMNDWPFYEYGTIFDVIRGDS